MLSIKAIKQKRNSIKGIQQATRAMNLVSTVKLQKARLMMEMAHPFIQGAVDIMMSAGCNEEAADHPIVKSQKKGTKNTAYIVITSNRGLCGGYNENVCKEAITHKRDESNNVAYYLIGSRGMSYFNARSLKVVEHYIVNDNADGSYYKTAKDISNVIISEYENGIIDEIYIAYTKCQSILVQEPKIEPILPLGIRPDYIMQRNTMEFEPDIKSFLKNMVKIYLSSCIYEAILNAFVSEQAARMVKMDSATNNAGEIIQDLTLMFNRQRQGIITQEIIEIVSGTNAVQQ